MSLPNPAPVNLNVDIQDNTISTIIIYNSKGQIHIARNNINASLTSVDIKDLDSGLYLLNITTTDNKKAIKSFVKI